MLGAIAGDIIGSVYEAWSIKSTNFPLFSPASTFTDDTVLSVAVAEVLLDGSDYVETYKRYFRRHPGRGFGGSFRRWAASASTGPYGSLGNGSAMRVSPVAWARETLSEVLAEARRSAAVTHDHPEGIRGAQAAAAAVFMARRGESREVIREALQARFGYNLHRSLAHIRPGYAFDVTCPGSVPEAILCFLESSDYEGAVRNAVSLGGDADTQACIAGAIAEAFYGGLPGPVRDEALDRLDEALRDTVLAFGRRFGLSWSEG